MYIGTQVQDSTCRSPFRGRFSHAVARLFVTNPRRDENHSGRSGSPGDDGVRIILRRHRRRRGDDDDYRFFLIPHHKQPRGDTEKKHLTFCGALGGRFSFSTLFALVSFGLISRLALWPPSEELGSVNRGDRGRRKCAIVRNTAIQKERVKGVVGFFVTGLNFSIHT